MTAGPISRRSRVPGQYLPKNLEMPMKSLRLLMILVTMSCAGCRKVPYSDILHAIFSHSTPQPAQVSVPSTPEPVAEGPVVAETDRTAQVIVLGYDRFVDKVR